jgi:hypothetical protein
MCGGRRSIAVGSKGRQEPWPSGAACGGCRSLRHREQRPSGKSAVSSRGCRARRTSERSIDCHGRWPSGAGANGRGERHARDQARSMAVRSRGQQRAASATHGEDQARRGPGTVSGGRQASPVHRTRHAVWWIRHRCVLWQIERGNNQAIR